MHILRGCIHDLAEQSGLRMQGRASHVLNRVLDEAIGSAVRSFATQKALEVQRRREEYLAFVAHDLWPLVEDLIHDLHPVAGTGSTRLVNAIPEDFVVYADVSVLRRVFQNLIANAIS